jgi:septal ring factor EnvC (AmiA/AmiB activator)
MAREAKLTLVKDKKKALKSSLASKDADIEHLQEELIEVKDTT